MLPCVALLNAGATLDSDPVVLSTEEPTHYREVRNPVSSLI